MAISLEILPAFLTLNKGPLECVVLFENPTANNEILFQVLWLMHLFNTMRELEIAAAFDNSRSRFFSL